MGHLGPTSLMTGSRPTSTGGNLELFAAHMCRNVLSSYGITWAIYSVTFCTEITSSPACGYPLGLCASALSVWGKQPLPSSS